jgi:hypothetical protein
MWGNEKLKEWVACKNDVHFTSDRYWRLVAKIDALYEALDLEYTEIPSKRVAIKKGK